MSASRHLVTGATGCLGRHPLGASAESDASVRAPVRSPSRTAHLESLAVLERQGTKARFLFSAYAEAFRLRRRAPHVHGYVWRLADPSAAVVLVHGLQSHAQWFAEAAESLRERGLSVYALDRRGSGSSPEARGDIACWREWMDEVDDVIRFVRSEHPDTPVHVIGHCFGANIAMACALVRRPAIRSLVMLTPGLHVLPDYRTVEKIQMLAGAVAAPSKRFRVPQDDELFTRDPDVLAWIHADRLGARTLTARCLVEIARMMRRLRRDLPRLDVPLLVVEAQHDRIADNARNRVRLARSLGSRWRVVTFDAEHFLLAEPCRDEVFDLIVRWTTSVASKSTKEA